MKKIIIIFCTLVSYHAIAQDIILDPNNSFFSPRGTLKLLGAHYEEDVFNRNTHFTRIANWKVLNDTIVWGLKDMQLGTVNIELFAGISANENNAEVSIFLDNQLQDLTVHATASLQDFQSQGVVSFTVNEPGTHEVKIKIKSQNSSDSDHFGEIEKLVVSGSAIDGASAWQRRWRAAAVHGRFSSPNHNQIEICVYNVKVKSIESDSYQVMTTEFGYIGSPNQPKGNGLLGLNFSVWSFGANQPIPPHNELSHLIAVGGENSKFGMYGHEGTGVKPRGFDPFSANAPEYEFTVAVRKISDTQYNTFWCYYLDSVDSEWKLYGSAKKFNESGNISYLGQTGGFLEVTGGPAVGRTGHRVRTVEYKGWRMSNDGSWNIINEVEPAYVDYYSTYKEWGQTSDGDAFVFKSGGFSLTGEDPGVIQLNNPPPLPFYLQNSYFDQLYKMPADFNTLPPEGNTLKFNIENLGTNPEIKVFYGTEKGLTEGLFQEAVIDTVWQEEKSISLSEIDNNTLSIPLTNLTPNTEYFYRLRVQNEEGITWSFNTESFTSAPALSLEKIKESEYNIMVYPNPTNNMLTLENSSPIGLNVDVYNFEGQLIFSQEIHENRINLERLSKGIYFLKFKTSKGIKIAKVIKE
jgi:hypothetical protein